MILDVVQAATEPAPWWMSATAPWWAAPVSTLVGALLAWLLARATASRNERNEQLREARSQKTQRYAEFWGAALEHHQIASMKSRIDAQDSVIRATQLMLSIELLAPDYVHRAALQVLASMMERDADGEQRGVAMRAFREAVAKELKLD